MLELLNHLIAIDWHYRAFQVPIAVETVGATCHRLMSPIHEMSIHFQSLTFVESAVVVAGDARHNEAAVEALDALVATPYSNLSCDCVEESYYSADYNHYASYAVVSNEVGKWHPC